MPVCVMLAVMDSREMVYWKALAKLEGEERLERKASADASAELDKLKGSRTKFNRSQR